MTAPVVYVGHGIVAPEYRWDDLAGVDLKGKVVPWCCVGAPLGTTRRLLPAHSQRGVRLAALEAGAAHRARRGRRALGADAGAGEDRPLQPRWSSHAQRGWMSLVENGLLPAREQLPQASLSMAGRGRAARRRGTPRAGRRRSSPPPSAASTPRSTLGARVRLRSRGGAAHGAHRERARAVARGARLADRGRDGGLHRAPRPPGHRQARGGGRHLQRRLGQRRRGGERPGGRPRLHPARRSARVARCSSPSSPARRKGCSARSGWWPIRRCRARRWSPT